MNTDSRYIIRMWVDGCSCLVKGLYTFITNLFTSEIKMKSLPENSFVSEYFHSFDNEVYPLIFPKACCGMLFEEVCPVEAKLSDCPKLGFPLLILHHANWWMQILSFLNRQLPWTWCNRLWILCLRSSMWCFLHLMWMWWTRRINSECGR